MQDDALVRARPGPGRDPCLLRAGADTAGGTSSSRTQRPDGGRYSRRTWRRDGLPGSTVDPCVEGVSGIITARQGPDAPPETRNKRLSTSGIVIGLSPRPTMVVGRGLSGKYRLGQGPSRGRGMSPRGDRRMRCSRIAGTLAILAAFLASAWTCVASGRPPAGPTS